MKIHWSQDKYGTHLGKSGEKIVIRFEVSDTSSVDLRACFVSRRVYYKHSKNYPFNGVESMKVAFEKEFDEWLALAGLQHMPVAQVST